MPIVEAARLEASAAPGQTLANAIVRSLVGTRRALRFRDVGELTLKGIPVPLATVEVIDENVVDTPRPVVPVPAPAATRPPRLAIAAVVALGGRRRARGSRSRRAMADRSAKPSSTTTPHLTGVTAPAGYTPRYQPMKNCPADVRQAAAETTCAHLIVPQDRSKPGGKPVTLLVTRAPARLPGRRSRRPSTCAVARTSATRWRRDHGELIHVGQRGYPEGTPVLTCPEFSASRQRALTQRSHDPIAIAAGTDALRTCYARLVARGIDPAQYNFDSAARDVLDLMFVLNIRSANFVAFESSSAEVFDVLRRAPAAVRSITLANPPPPGETVFTDPIADLAGAFTRFVSLCNADSICSAGYPELAAKWRSAYLTADANPQLVTVPNPEGSNPADAAGAPRRPDACRLARERTLQWRCRRFTSCIPTAITQSGIDAVIASAAVEQETYRPDAPWAAYASYLCAYDVHTVIRARSPSKPKPCRSM